MPVNISHIKALGVDVHGQAPAIVARVEAARRAGQGVTADQYPWSASGHEPRRLAGAALGAGRRPGGAARAASTIRVAERLRATWPRICAGAAGRRRC